MNPEQIYAKTALGEDAVRQTTRVVQRNLRMVLVLVDGALTVRDLAAKIGDQRLVTAALHDLEEGGFIELVGSGSRRQDSSEPYIEKRTQLSALSQFSTFGSKPTGDNAALSTNFAGGFSAYGKPVYPSSSRAVEAAETVAAEPVEPRQQERPSIPVHRAKRLGYVVLVIVLGLCGLALFYPYGNFKPAIEAMASRYLGVPVIVGRVSLALLPRPELVLADVQVGDSSRIDRIGLASPYRLLGGGAHLIPRVRVSGAHLDANHVLLLPGLRNAVQPELLFERIDVENSQLAVNDLVLPDVSGEMVVAADGGLESGTFRVFGNIMRVGMMPAPQGVDLRIEAHSWLPNGLAGGFDSLQAKGVLQKNRLLIQNFDSAFLGGIVRGNLLFDWSSGWAVAGEAVLSRLDCQKVSAALAPSLKWQGTLSGPLRFRGSGGDWGALWRQMEVMLDADIARGMFVGLDLGEAARRGHGAEVRAGATRFDRARMSIEITPRQVVGRNIRLEAGLMTATGQFVASRNGQVDGNLTVGIQTSVSPLQVPVRLTGTLPDLTAVGGK